MTARQVGYLQQFGSSAVHNAWRFGAHAMKDKWSQLIEPKFGKLTLGDLSPADVRTWFSALEATKETRNRHAYSIVSMICNTAVVTGWSNAIPA